MAKKYSADFKERAIRTLEDHQRVHACSKWGVAEAGAHQAGGLPATSSYVSCTSARP